MMRQLKWLPSKIGSYVYKTKLPKLNKKVRDSSLLVGKAMALSKHNQPPRVEVVANEQKLLK